MTTEDNKAIIRRIIEEGFNQSNLAVFDELYASNFVHHDPSNPTVQTRDDYKRWASQTRTAFPDYRLTIEDMVAEGNEVVTRWSLQGTQTGAMETPMQIPATGKHVTIVGITIARLAGNQLVEDWHLPDTMGFLQQIGVVPVQGPASQ
jgi:steroid delta-isomerase-like uncharacterized protein